MVPSPGWSWSDVDVAVPGPAGRLPGVAMAGFRQRIAGSVDIAMVAHPAITVLFDLTGDIVCDARGRRRRGSFVAGLLPGEVRTGGRRGECLQVRLTPVVAAAVLGASAELTGTVASLDEVWGRDAERVEERLRAAKTWDARFAIAAEAIGRRLESRPVDAEVAQAWRRTLAARGAVRVDGLAGEVGWSRQRLWSRFRAQLGVTPKRAAGLVRFDHAAHLLAAGHTAASVAARSGYADQSHLHREVKAITGTTPTAVATAPWLAIDEVAWPAPSRGRVSG
ncbi:helix-turn-helix domain-containing protein [Amycolatopsis nalaikhensis]|uniref:Helix-turn-helix domain-containing protein n=1 Tax=Amycolatopsis nalaikhensis TaxID=715472 RepID=A0ABY8Y2C1_9PSEU|nr:helix-turn-helix domain-containing protein [Amycolatopsis sp. 2-2]WIV61781.1 helix-turn-helix domain-containing protein [Amycolatopsis sp. 2-2]